jgi:hypothetical protein
MNQQIMNSWENLNEYQKLSKKKQMNGFQEFRRIKELKRNGNQEKIKMEPLLLVIKNQSIP